MRALALALILLSGVLQTSSRTEPDLLGSLGWRSIGPAMFGGRVVDVAGVPGKPDLLFVGAASSGLYKSTNGGITFESIFNDGNTLSIGAIAVQPDNPDIIYVGTGEGFPRNSISFGDGLYKTTDGGQSWKHLGLADSERFSRIVIHPANPPAMAAAALNVRGELRAIAVDLAGDPREPNHLNLRGKINWLRIQVGNYSGRPTSAQLEWIGRFVAEKDRLARELDAVTRGSLATLNQRLKAAGFPEIR